MSFNSSHFFTNTLHRDQRHTPSPLPIPSPASQRTHAFFKPFFRVCRTWCHHIAPFAPAFCARLMTVPPHPQAASPPRPAAPALPLNPAIQTLANVHMEQTAAQVAAEEARIQAQDLAMRTDSLLHTAVKQGQPDDLASAFATLRALLKWREASLSQYGAWMTEADPTIGQALLEWEQSNEALRLACRQDKGDARHAEESYQAIQALAVPNADRNATVRYAGAFGKQQNLLQATLKKLYACYPKTKPLPDCIKEGMEQGAIDSLEDLLSYGIDLLWKQILQDHPNLAPSEKIGDALALLKPYLPDLKRRAPHLLESHLPTGVKETVNETLQQGLFSLFLDLLPDSLLRDNCVDLVQILAKGAHAEDLPEVLLEWKQRFIQKAVSLLPLSACDVFNEEMEKGFHTFLHGFNDIVDGLGAGLQQRVHETLFSYGTYLLEWKVDADDKTYSVTIFASGSSLNASHYPRDLAGNPLWPICLRGIALTPALLQALQQMSAATAVTKGWKRKGDANPLAHAELFGPEGLIPLLQSMGAQLDPSVSVALPTLPKMLSELDMVSLYCHPSQNPDLLRYKLLRHALLKACAPFGHVSADGGPPTLAIPEGKDGAALIQCFQSAARTLRAHAINAGIAPEGLREIAAFEQQLMLAGRKPHSPTVQTAASAMQEPVEDPLDALEKDESLGILLDTLLKGWCSSYGQVHPLEKYQSLLRFALGGEQAKDLVTLLCRRASTLQKRAQAQAAAASVQADRAPAAAPSSLAALLSPPQVQEPHRERGAVGKMVHSPMMRTFLQIFYCMGQLELALSYGWKTLSLDILTIVKSGVLSVVSSKIFPKSIQRELQALYEQLYILYDRLYTYVTDTLRDFIFALLFPYLEGNESLIHLREQIAPYLTALPGVALPSNVPISLPQPAHVNLRLHPKDRLTYIPATQIPITSSMAVEDHFFYSAQDRCRGFDQCFLECPFIQLPNILSKWTLHCQDLPHLLIHLIHTLPILPTSSQFTRLFSFTFDASQYRETVHKILLELEVIGELLYSCFTLGQHEISWRDYQLAQYRLLAFTDILIRKLSDHPLGNFSIDADPLLQEWMDERSDARHLAIYPESREHARTVLRYFYPDLELEDLLENPPSETQRAEWQKWRWFSGIHGCFDTEPAVSDRNKMDTLIRNIAALDSPEIRYYRACLTRKNHAIFYIHEGQPVRLHLFNPDGSRSEVIVHAEQPLRISPAETLQENIFDLFCIAHATPEEQRAFRTPLHWTLPLIGRQADRAMQFKQIITCRVDESTDRYSLYSKFALQQRFIPADQQEAPQTPENPILKNLWKVIEISSFRYRLDMIDIVSEPLIPVHVRQELPTKRHPVTSYFDEALWEDGTEHSQCFKQECHAAGMQRDASNTGEPLTGPSRALRILADHPNACKTHFNVIWKLLLCHGHIEIDWKENPALIEHYALAMRSALHATDDLGVMLRICKLTLALRNRAWSVGLDTQAFSFLDAAFPKLFELATDARFKWDVLALQTLHQDHPRPRTLSQEQQKQTVSRLLSTLNAFQNYFGFGLDTPTTYYVALQQMAMRWYPCLQNYHLDSLPAIRPTHVDISTSAQRRTHYWQEVMKSRGISELILEDETPVSSTWMQTDLHDVARIHRRVGDVTYTLLIDPQECSQLLDSISSVFHWIRPLQAQELQGKPETPPEKRVQCWMHRHAEQLLNATILVTQGEAQWSFILEEHHHTQYRLLGMLDEDGVTVVYPASSTQVRQWCAPWAHFVPLSSMVLLVSRHTQRPVRCLMPSLNLEFSFIQTPEGQWRGENSKLYPGYWIAKQQTMPFGLILENQEGERRLLLPSHTLPHQALYTQMAPVFGILGNAVQRQKLFHTTGSVHCYHCTNNQWTSTDPFAMVHLLLLYFASQNKEAMRLTGETLLRMPLPANLEMELLPLHISRNRKVRRLHAQLLAQLETSLLADIPVPSQPPLMGQYLPTEAAKLLSLITVYRTLACESSDDLPDTMLHTLFARYRRLLHANQAALVSLFECQEMMQVLSIDWLALRLLPKSVQARVIREELAIGNGLHPIDYALRFRSEWRLSASLDSSPWVKQACAVKNFLQLGGSASQTMPSLQSGLVSALRMPLMAPFSLPLQALPFKATCIRYLTQLKAPSMESLSKEDLLKWSAQVKLELIPTLAPELIASQTTLIPYFLTYQAMAQGQFGQEMQLRLIRQLYLLQWTPLPHPQKTLSHILLTIATHPNQYAVFHRLHNKKHSLHRLLIEQQEERQQEQQAEAPEIELLANGTLIRREEQKKRAQEQRELALIHQWHLLTRYQHVQTQWDHIGHTARRGLELLGTYYVLPMLSENLLHRAVSCTTQRLASMPPPTSSQALPLGLTAIAGLAGYVFYRSYTRPGIAANPPPFRASAVKTPRTLRTFNRLTGLSVTPQSLVTYGTTALTVFGTRVLSQYAYETLIPALVNRATALMPSRDHPPTRRQCLLTAIPLVTSVYMLNRMYRTRQRRTANKQPKTITPETAVGNMAKAVGRNLLSTMTVFGAQYLVQYAHHSVFPSLTNRAQALVPVSVAAPDTSRRLLACIPLVTGAYSLYRMYHIHQKITGCDRLPALLAPSALTLSTTCQNALYTEDQRWKGFLDQLFNAHFAAETLDQPHVQMEHVHSLAIQNSLAHYHRHTEPTRTLYFLRAPETLGSLGEQIDTTLSSLKQLQEQERRALFKALKIPQENQAEAMEGFRRFFAVQEVGVLNAFGVTEAEKRLLLEILPPFLLRETQIEQLRKIAKALKPLQDGNLRVDSPAWNAACEQLITHMQARRMYAFNTLSTQRLSFFLAFESSTGTLLWKQQVETLSKVLDAGDKSVAYELLMSLGKTFFAIPITALSFADGKHTVFMVWPEAMFATQTRETGEQLFLLAGRPVTPLKIDRSFPLTPERLDALLRLFRDTQIRQGAISTRKKDLQVLELLLLQQLNTLDNKSHAKLTSQEKKQIWKLRRLLLILMESGIYIGDEAHQLFQDIVLHFPVGPKEHMATYEAHAARKVMEELLRSELGRILRTYTRLNDHAESAAIFQQERTRIARQIVEGTLCGKIDEEQRLNIFHYLLDKSTPTPQWLIEDPTRHKMRSKIDAARGVLLFLFPLFFSRSIGGDFGRSKKHPNLLHVIPYHGHDHPAEAQRIATLPEAQAKSLVDAWHHQLALEDFKHLLNNCDTNSKKWAQKKQRPYEESPDACAFAALFAPGTHTLSTARHYVNQPERLEQLLRDVQDPINLLLLYSRCCIEPSLECQEAQISSSSHDFHAMFLRGTVCTGTAYNASIYPISMQRQLNAGTMGEAITHIKRKCPPGGILFLTQAQPWAILREVVRKFFLSDIQATALQDGGGMLTGISHKDVASYMLTEVHQQRPTIKVVDYFALDPQSGETVPMSLIFGANDPIPLHACKIPLENRIAFFDESHCFAANIPQAFNGKGVLLIRSGYELYNALQGAYRMRGLKKYTEYMGVLNSVDELDEALQRTHQSDLIATQTLYIALDPQVGSSVGSKDPLQLLDRTLDYAAEQEQRNMETINLRGGVSMLRALLRKAHMHALLKAPKLTQLRDHFHCAKSLLVTPTPQRASHLYGGARIVVTGKQLVQRHYDQACARVDANSMLSRRQRQEAKTELTQVFQHVMQLPLPNEVPITVDQEGAYVLDADHVGQEVEMEVEQEAEAEREREQERETEREIQRQIEYQAAVQPLAITPKPWDKTCPLDSSKWQWLEFTKHNDNPLSQVKASIKVMHRFSGQLSKTNKQEWHPPYSPPLFILQHLLQYASEKILNDLSTTIDPRIWWSNHLLPQIHLPFGATPAQPATGAQHNITHLLIELQPETAQTPAHILSVGCLGATDATYWIKRLQSEHRHQAERQPQGAPGERLFLIYQMPVLENLDPKQQFDGTVIAYNQDHNWNPQDSQDFARLEVMIKLCNGDKRYTPAQCALLKAWKNQYPSRNALALNRAFALFSMMAQERSGIPHTFRSLNEILDPLDEEA